ncbi:tetraspanin-8-like [Spinachia spinachia]
MGKANVCLKRSYNGVVTLIAILSGLMLAATLFSHGYLHNHDEIETMILGIYSTYGICVITLILATVGVYGACKEKKWALIVFEVGMILGSLLLIAIDIGALAGRLQQVEDLKRHYLEMLPLSNASESTTDTFKYLQTELQCCGLHQGYLDWGYNIPESCQCTEKSTNPCVAAPRNSSIFELKVDDRPVLIYKEACLPYVISYVRMVLDTTMGILLGVTLLWVLSVVLGIFLLLQMSKREDVPVVVYSQHAKAGNYSPLAEIVEHT